MRACRWQTGDCGVYAWALTEAAPHLRLGAVLAWDHDVHSGHALHYFAHDDSHAYDSTGRHALPYVRVWDSALRDYFPAESAAVMGFRCVLDLDPATFGELSDEQTEALPAARRHIRRRATLGAPR